MSVDTRPVDTVVVLVFNVEYRVLGTENDDTNRDWPISVENIGMTVETLLAVILDRDAVEIDKVDAMMVVVTKVLPDRLE